MLLEPVSDVDVYFSAPAGKVLRRKRFFCSSPGGDLYSLWAWGRLDLDDTHELMEVLEAVVRHPGPRRQQLVVLREVRHVTLTSMQLFTRRLGILNRYRGTIAREVVVRPAGVAGFMAAGFYEVMPQPYEGRVFSELWAALRWLRPDPRPWADWVEAAVRLEAAACAEELRDLALLPAVFEEAGLRVSVGDAARRLGLSTRSLQRRLGEAGTTFELQRRRAVVLRAQELLGTGADVKVIAHQTGFRSASAFIEMFRRATGKTPGEWRAWHLASLELRHEAGQQVRATPRS